MISGLDHLQIEAPPGHEAPARAFYGNFLGLVVPQDSVELS